ncbi:hypothetical protein CKM354_001125400 [Cercospora kikuchii]|uniref:Aminoglycoside phosphotransferase domain-containing protein n=1 Tax=Cercospora kikuchii TaxID=84275 RepID=A0A9P3FI53_9PEZI|nr:uncharacterized protein CKM354_001125400 [Cercospora kikuchii]GIZ48181.1 hypothetical protein CKM354_001125400 [Cercospora kikuchii]
MSDLFDTHSNVKQTACDKYAQEVVGGPIQALDWQGYYSYTVESKDGHTIVQFRSDKSPLDQEIVDLAKRVHPDLVPGMVRLGLLGDSTVSVWKMDKIPGVGFLMMIHDDNIKTKVLTTAVDMAKFYAAAWKCPQKPSPERVLAVRQECETKLLELANSSPAPLQIHISESRAALDDIFELPWVLTHDDLSSMNLLMEAATGHLKGIVDWADAAIWPFGVALWGVESILGYDSPDGWTWLDDEAQTCRASFSATFQQEADGISADQLILIEKTRNLGLLLRYGFVWRDGKAVPTEDITTLEGYLRQIMFRQ